MKLSKIAVLLAAILILQSVVFTTQNHIITQTIEPFETQLELAYTPHSAMNITSNADFSAHSWNGSGTEGDRCPKLIQSWTSSPGSLFGS